ncbi:MAG: BamA/TamA family outer membrane protein [Saprospiraceae bacterium]|nr:BamA/TamA family outer membrane protein [Lewinella sp.]
MNRKLYIVLLLIILLESSCSVNKLLPEGEKLYAGASLTVVKPDTLAAANLQSELQSVIIPQPNTTIFGFPWKVWFNLKFKTDKEKGFNHWLSTTIGKPPVIYDPDQTRQVIDLLENRAQNLGHFKAKAESTVDEGAKRAKVQYTVKAGIPYRIDSLELNIRDTTLSRRIQALESGSEIHLGKIFSLDDLKAERIRLEDSLREAGYYYFSANNLEYFADTVSSTGERKVELLLKLKNDLSSQQLIPQRIKAINIYPNYDPAIGAHPDSTGIHSTGIRLFCNECTLKEESLTEAFAIRPGQLHRPSTHRKTLERLSNLNTFKYINLRYDSVPGTDSLLVLNAFLSPRAKRTIEGDVGITYNTGRYLGPEISLQYSNRNLFRGAEYLTLNGSYAYNTFLGPADQATIPKWTKFSAGASLSVPRFWLPNRKKLSKDLQYANTRIKLSLDNENLGFRLANLSTQINDLGLTSLQEKLAADPTFTPPVNLSNYQLKYGYNWQKINTIQQEVNPLVIRLQTVNVDDPELLALFRAFSVGEQSSLVRLERMQLFSPDYTFLYDSRKADKVKAQNIFYRQRLSFNVNRVTPLSGADNPAPETSLFLQWETDFHYYYTLKQGRQLASRLRAYAGYPITKTATIPYFDLYTVGGSNSLRGFPPRGVGPGSIVPNSEDDFTIFTGYGNILLEANVEFRQRLGTYFEVAPFIDVGNVWQYRTQSDVPQAEFSFDRLLPELAIDAGIGFRYDLDFLIIRTDFAWPVTQPWLPEGERLVIGQFFNGSWWWDNLNFVLAFGYPF